MRIEAGPARIYLSPLPEGLPKREAERAAVHSLIQTAFGHPTELIHDASGRPLIEGVSVSVSHSRTYAALAVAPPQINIGIDIEENAGKAARIISRVLRGPNSALYTNPLQAWTLLEAAFKATAPNQGLTLVDFFLPPPGETPIMVNGRPEVRLTIAASYATDFGWLSLVTSPILKK